LIETVLQGEMSFRNNLKRSVWALYDKNKLGK